MKIKRIEFMEEITDLYNDNIDVLVENEDGYNYIVGVGTPQNLTEEMNQEKANFFRPGTPKIIVKKLTKEIVTEAIEAYAEDTGYWLKLHQFANSSDISSLNKLKAEPRKKRQKKLNQGDFMGDPNNPTEFEIGYFIGSSLGTYIIIRVVIKGVKIILKYLK